MSEEFDLMMPNRLARAFGRLHASVTRSRVLEVVGPLRLYATEERPEVRALLETFAELSTGHAQFGEPERALLGALGLTCLVDATWWARLVAAAARASVPDDVATDLLEMRARLQFVVSGFPALAGLLEDRAVVTEGEPNGLVLTLPTADGGPASLTRVASAIQGVNELWTVANDLTGQPGPLQLVATEPGPPTSPMTSLCFDGAPDPLDELRNLLIAVWGISAQLAGTPIEQQAALIPDKLPVMERIGRHGRGHGAHIRDTIETGVRHLLDANCSLPGMPPTAPLDPAPADLTTVAASALPVHTASLRAAPLATQGLSSDDMSHLAEVIAEERRQLPHTGPSRRIWQGATAPSRS
jgi:hypothetical protein